MPMDREMWDVPFSGLMGLLALLLMFGSSIALAGNGSAPAGSDGTYVADTAASDTMSVTGNVKVTGASYDYSGTITWTIGSDAKSVEFSGRAAYVAALYTLYGESIGGGGPGEGTGPNEWTSHFSEENKLTLVVQVNGPSPDDNWITCRGSSDMAGTVTIKLLGTGTDSIGIDLGPTSHDVVQLGYHLNLTPGSSMVVNLFGMGLGQVDITAAATNPTPVVVPGKDHVEVLPKVTFSPELLKTGFTKDGSKDIRAVLTATVEPKEGVAQVTFAGKGKQRVSFANLRVNAETGVLTVDVKGTSATPADKPQGDTTIRAMAKNKEVATVNAVVIVPAAIGTPHPQPKEIVVGRNMALDAKSSPSASGVPPNKKALCTVYGQWLTVPVLDQFKNRLDALYDGVPVTENGGEFPTNQKMRADGTWVDPVCVLIPRADPFVLAGSDAETNWPGQELLPPPADNQSPAVNMPVEVGGHSLSPAIVNRTKKYWTDADHHFWLQILWPD